MRFGLSVVEELIYNRIETECEFIQWSVSYLEVARDGFC